MVRKVTISFMEHALLDVMFMGIFKCLTMTLGKYVQPTPFSTEACQIGITECYQLMMALTSLIRRQYITYG